MMEIDEDDILRNVVAGGSMDYSVWPALLPRIVSRIEKIAHNEFPIPNLPPPAPIILPSSIVRPPPSDSEDNFLPPLPSSPTNPPSTSSSQETNKENTPIASRTAPPPPAAPAPPPAPELVHEPLPPGTLPVQVTNMLTEITQTLISTFPTYPPHTVQRLSELVLAPRHHYKSLPAYLHALNRVVHVTSGLNVYPLPPAIPDMSTAGGMLSNGISEAIGPNPFATPGSDEALGGALLTPIPWLQPRGPEANALSPGPSSSQTGSSMSPERTNGGGAGGQETAPNESPELRTESTETIEGPNGMGSIETVTVTVNGLSSMGARGVGVTQGELLRQEQRAGVVPVSQLASHLSSSHHHHAAAAAAAAQQRATSSTASGNILATAEQPVESSEVVRSVQGADEDEKPHARGPDEIGAEDMGPQREGSNTSYHVGGPPGNMEMQGIDVEAAVGRKASDSQTTSPEPKPTVETQVESDETKAGVEDVKMDGVEPSRARSATPKREAEDELESERKKLKEDPKAATPTVDEGPATAQSPKDVQTKDKTEVKSDNSEDVAEKTGAKTESAEG